MLVFSIRAVSKVRGVFLCEALYCVIRRFGVLMSLFCMFICLYYILNQRVLSVL